MLYSRSRRIRSRRGSSSGHHFDRLHSKSPPDELLQAILENIGSRAEYKPTAAEMPPTSYVTVSSKQLPRRGRLGATNRRQRRSDGAAHFQDGTVIVEDVPPASTPTLVVNEAGQMACAWSYINPSAVPPFGHGVAVTRFDDEQWEGSLHGFNLFDDAVASNPVMLAIPGANMHIVVFTRIDLPNEVLAEASMSNAAGGELFYATMASAAPDGPGNASEPGRLTDNNVMDASQALHEAHGSVLLTYFRQNSANIADPVFTLLTRQWDHAASTFREEGVVATGDYAGPAQHSQTADGAEIIVFYQLNSNRTGYVVVYSWRLPATEWSAPARVDLSTVSDIQRDAQLLGGRSDGKFLVGWLSENVVYYRLVSLYAQADSQAPASPGLGPFTLSGALATHTTEKLLSVRAAGHEISYLATLDTELAPMDDGRQNRSLHSENRVLHFHSLPDAAGGFGDDTRRPIPIAQATLVDKKEIGHTLAYDAKHSRVVIATQEELVDTVDIRLSVHNLRVDTVNILPDLAVEDMQMDPARPAVTFRVTNRGLLPAPASEVEVFRGTLAREIVSRIVTQSVPALLPGETKHFRVDVPHASLADATLSRVWANVVTNFEETSISNNHKSAFPHFSALSIHKAGWRPGTGASITIEASLQSTAAQDTRGSVGMAICTLLETKDGNGVVYNESWHVIGRAEARVDGRVGYGSFIVPAAALLSNTVLVLLTHDQVGLETSVVDLASASKIHAKRVKVPLKPNLYVDENSVSISQQGDQVRRAVFDVVANIKNTGLSAVENASVQIWLPGARANASMTLAEQAHTGLLLRQDLVSIGGRSNTSVVFETDGIRLGHSKVVVLLNEDRNLEESAYADNAAIKHVHLAASAQIQIDVASATLAKGNSAISALVRNTGGEDHRMGSLFALATNADGLDDFEHQVLGEPARALSVPAGGAHEFVVDLHDISMLTDCTHRNVMLAYVQAEQVVDGRIPLASAIAAQAETPTGSVVFIPIETLLDDGDACDRRTNWPPVADNQTRLVFQDAPVPIKCAGYDPEDDAFVCM